MPVSEAEKESRKRFYRETGKTPEDEASDSLRAAGVFLIVASLSFLVGLIVYFW